MNPFDVHRINVIDGYLNLDFEYCVSAIISSVELVHANDEYMLYRLPLENLIYILSIPGRGTYLMYHNSLDVVHVKKCIKDLYNGKIYYINYDEKGESLYCKSISPDIRTKPTRMKFVNQIIDKIKLHPKLTINLLLTGPPGTGKSSFVEVVAKQYMSDVHVIPTQHKETLSKTLNVLSKKKNIVILLPEIDKLLDDMGNLDGTELYEFLDGSNTPTGSIIIITCNDAEKFHKNKILSRPGRIHFVHEFGMIEKDDIDFIVHKYYPEYDTTRFHKYVGKVTHAEFHTAVCQKYIIDESLESLEIKPTSYKKSSTNIYF
jgi:ATPase family associated with various cellular activities (AAA)